MLENPGIGANADFNKHSLPDLEWMQLRDVKLRDLSFNLSLKNTPILFQLY
jgi:hypothetical protein